eukprot:CAMPEP_0113591044 /NCGR_PEP_ID=MMETSP0015_2-20120614/37028_1 /TAXON_ID=2838 /ORGANISM="Odontella" /LENGTH=146 /DNA_ID=CAMNT_0000497337 /DNA_START=101 /DNA_END=539 /DNA_ORIENTATION=+ /assembly_acc=CAM_ASM_000160
MSSSSLTARPRRALEIATFHLRGDAAEHSFRPCAMSQGDRKVTPPPPAHGTLPLKASPPLHLRSSASPFSVASSPSALYRLSILLHLPPTPSVAPSSSSFSTSSPPPHPPQFLDEFAPTLGRAAAIHMILARILGPAARLGIPPVA